MRHVRKSILALLAFFVLATPVLAKEYYEFYEDGLKAMAKKDYATVISLMTEAINREPEENKRARSYGANFFAYHPYYYRGIAHYNTGQYEKAITDLQRALDNGKINLGTPESWVVRAEQRILAGQQAPPPTTPPVSPPSPVTPQVDPALAPARKQAEDLMAAADQKASQARSARANTLAASDYGAAQQKLVNARSRSVSAGTTADWNEVARLADQAGRQFDLAIASARAAAQQTPVTPPPVIRPTTTATTRPTTTPATSGSTAAMKTKVREALNYYFSGQFDRSEFQFEQLTREAASNPMVWAFLGASRYSHYILEGESRDDLRRGAADAFKRAREIKPGLRLDDKYFSSRIRNFYESVN
jgi:tetratricopeptide (TPR) repeat protein